MHEMSMNFDMENVKPFLQQIKPLFESGFGEKEVEQAYAFTKSLQHNDEKEIKFVIEYQGKKEWLHYAVFMDDIEAPDIYFFTETESLPEKSP